VCGRRRERFPQATVFNRLCDLEWDTPVGDVAACGGDAMFRAAAFRDVGGFDATLIAGEEPELCVRLRGRGWKVRRLAAEMTLHDAAMTHWRQWWKRSMRAGHAYAEGAALHGEPPERHWVREARSNWTWGIAVPLLAVVLAWPTRGLSLLLLFGFVVLAWRVWRHGRRRAWPAADARAYALFTVLGKFPMAVGQMQFFLGQVLGRRSRLIEYKGTAT
jgi:GT2 family glycosyltransferase